ncbi:hypothetical protein Sjap_023207 [Stephania japonica]|uniref:DUF7788 domain-containing protein n=1 Tax=Stephania japonica TaxID=461633 RepID=A0AAP0HP16_9MAGN
MVEDLSKKGKLKNCIAVCYASGSMSGTPMNVCIALGLLTPFLSEDPWKNKVITFSQDPQLHPIQGDNLKSNVESIKRMSWEMNTDFQKVFDLILKVAVNWNLRDSNATPVIAVQKGVALVSGFSKNMLKLFMEEGRDLNPDGISNQC